MKIVVLGAGRVGSAIAADLAAEADFQVTAVDRSAAALDRLRSGPVAHTVQADLADPARIRALALEHDLVVGAVPAGMGYRTVEAAIQAGRHVVDISFFEEDPLRLEALARERGVVAVMDAGVSPGLSNIILGYQEAVADRVSRYVCYVGGPAGGPRRLDSIQGSVFTCGRDRGLYPPGPLQGRRRDPDRSGAVRGRGDRGARSRDARGAPHGRAAYPSR